MFRADLHCHTTCSDGTYSPVDLVKLAHETGLNGLSITDHDTVEAYKSALPAARNYDLPLVSGVEFSAVHRQHSVHILAYSFPLDSTLIQDFCLQHSQQRLKRNQAILNKLTSQGMPIQEEEIYSHSKPFHTVGRPHIALAMLKKGYVTSIQEAFSKYIGEGKPCYEMGRYFDVEETIDLIHRAKGLAIIAHPHLIEESQILLDLLRMNFDGIEGYYGRFQPKEQERWVKIGLKKGWIITGGSDFHGDIKPNLSLGNSWVNQETFTILLEHFNKNSTS